MQTLSPLRTRRVPVVLWISQVRPRRGLIFTLRVSVVREPPGPIPSEIWFVSVNQRDQFLVRFPLLLHPGSFPAGERHLQTLGVPLPKTELFLRSLVNPLGTVT